MEVAKNALLDGVTFSGGEPFLQPKPLAELAATLNSMKKNIVKYSGYTYEQLMAKRGKHIRKLLEQTDLLIDGAFIKEQRTINLSFRGSKNQRN